MRGGFAPPPLADNGGFSMSNQFLAQPILSSPYRYPGRHWELDEQGQPTQRIIESRRRADFITPIPRGRRSARALSVRARWSSATVPGYRRRRSNTTPRPSSELRRHLDQWRGLPNPNDWLVTPETARLLQHWRHHAFQDIRPFFCQVEAVEALNLAHRGDAEIRQARPTVPGSHQGDQWGGGRISGACAPR